MPTPVSRPKEIKFTVSEGFDRILLEQVAHDHPTLSASACLGVLLVGNKWVNDWI